MIDRKAMVQTEGSHLWRPLKEVLIELQVAARQASRQRSKSAQDSPRPSDGPARPPVDPPDDDLDDGPPIGIGASPDDGPPIGSGEVEDDGPPIGIGEPAGIQTLADEPDAPVRRETTPADDLPAIPLKPLDGVSEVHFPPESPPESPVEPPAPDEHPILEVLGTDPSEPPPAPTVDSPVVEENPILQVLGDEPRTAGPGPEGPEPEALDEMPVIPFKPLGEDQPGEPFGDAPRGPAPADEPLSPAPWQQQDLPPAPPPPPPEKAASPALPDDDVAPVPSLPPSRPAFDDEPPATPAQSLEEEEAETLPPTPAPDEGAPAGGLGARLLGPMASLGAFFSRLLEPINRLERGQPLRDPQPGHQMPTRTTPALQKLRDTVSSWAGALGERVAQLTRREGPVAPVPPVDPAPLPMEPEGPSVDPATLPIEPLASAVEPGVAPAEPEPPLPEPPLAEPPLPEPEGPPIDGGPAPFDLSPASEPRESPESPVALRSSPRDVFQPPPPATELPSVPLAETHEPREVGDMYEGDDGESVLPILWHWTKRLVLLAVLFGGGAFVALNWKSWIPAAAEIGNRTFTEIDKYARSGERREQQDRILQEIGPQLAQLAPETIRLILSRSPTGVLDAGEVFWTATEASDRGLDSLTSEEAQELEALRRDLIDGLTPSERGRVEEYERTRANREPFPVENDHALALYARGARSLPPEKRERLQALLGKAITAGLTPPPGEGPP